MQVQHRWSNLDAIFSSSCHSGRELDEQRAAQEHATEVLGECMARFRGAPGIAQVGSHCAHAIGLLWVD